MARGRFVPRQGWTTCKKSPQMRRFQAAQAQAGPLSAAWHPRHCSGIRPDHGGMQDVALRSRYQGIERPAGRQHQFISASEGIDTGSVEAHDRGSVRPVAKRLAVASRDVDLIADPDVSQETEM